MPQRNLNIIMVAALLSLICYHRAARTRYAAVFAEALNRIEADYVEPVDQRKLFNAAMNGMMSELDQYSTYIEPERAAEFNAEIDQKFGGVGVEVALDPATERLMIVNALPGKPAYMAGSRSGDLIMAVDGKSTEGMTLGDAVGIMRGVPGTTVVVTVQHEGDKDTVDLKIKRAMIEIESVYGDTRNEDGTWNFRLAEDPDIAYVRIVSFGKNTAVELGDILRRLKKEGAAGLILDVRGNPGGLLDVAVEMCDMFVDEGVIVSTIGRGGKVFNSHTYSATKRGTIIDNGFPIAVLVDEHSASASEIFAACLQDYERAVVVGERTWGKGTVQNISALEGGRSELKLTVATYWRPSGKNIHRLGDDREDTNGEWGVRPDPGMEVKMDDDQLRELYRWQRAHAAIPNGHDPDVSEEIVNQPRPDPVLKRALEYFKTQAN